MDCSGLCLGEWRKIAYRLEISEVRPEVDWTRRELVKEEFLEMQVTIF